MSDKSRRLFRLRARDNFYALLALDHGLTVGSGRDAPPQNANMIIDQCETEISGVVLTYGMALSCGSNLRPALVLQCFGAPMNAPRVQIASIDQALRLDAAAVSVQLNLGSSHDLSSQSREISNFVSKAHRMALPVLFMVSGLEPLDSEATVKSVRICQEMGADLIKIACGLSEIIDENAFSIISSSIKSAPPVLLAGGPPSQHIIQNIEKAKELGFSGYCVGRSIFHSTNPHEMAASIRNAFMESKP